MPVLTVDQNGAGQRLDRFLRKVLHRMPVGHVFKLLRTRKVRVNGKRAQAHQILAAGDVVLIHMPDEQFRRDTLRPPRRVGGIDFQLRFEDEFLLVVSKPPFLPVHPGAGHGSNSLIDQIHAYLEVDRGASAFRPSLVHRLDRDTSGLIVVGKTIEVVRRLGRVFQQGRAHKGYLALARGIPRPRQGTWELEVQRRDVPGKNRGRSPTRGRKDARGRTAYRVSVSRKLQPPGKGDLTVSLLVLRLLTGRTHQIRSHLLQAGHPLAGDTRYGDRELNRLLKERYALRRQFLHAYRLSLDHPVTGKRCRWTDPFPADLDPITRSLRLRIPKE